VVGQQNADILPIHCN